MKQFGPRIEKSPQISCLWKEEERRNTNKKIEK